MDVKDYWKKISGKIGSFKVLGKLDFLEGVLGAGTRIGLDIGIHSVKFVQLEEGPGGLTLVKAGYKEIPQDFSEPKDSGVIEGAAANALRELWQEQKMGGQRVRLAVSDTSIYSRHISIPKVAEEELVKAIKWQAEKYIPFSIDEAVVDFQNLGAGSKKDPGQMEIVVVAAKKETVNKYINLLKQARITPSILDICSFAMVKSFLKNYSLNKEEMAAIIDIGANTSSVVIVKGGCLQFIRNIELAGNNFTQVLAKGLNVEEKEAERIKKEASLYPSEEEKKEKPNIFPVIEPLLSELAKEINRSFAYCEKELFTQGIDKVVLCGACARFKGLDKFLTEQLGVLVEIGNPFKNIAVGQIGVDASVLENACPSLMAAVGAALS